MLTKHPTNHKHNIRNGLSTNLPLWCAYALTHYYLLGGRQRAGRTPLSCMCVCGTSASNEFGNTPCFKGPPSEVPPTANMNSFSTLQQLSHAPVDCLTVAAVATMKEQHGLAGLGSRHWGGGLLEGLVPQSLLEKKPGSRHPTCPTSVGDFPISGYWDGRPMPRPDKAFSLSRPFLLGTLPDLGSGGPSSTLLLDPTHYRIQDHSFETTTAHCSLPMHTCPSDEVGPSPRWCCAALANPHPLTCPSDEVSQSAPWCCAELANALLPFATSRFETLEFRSVASNQPDCHCPLCSAPYSHAPS